MPFGVVECDDVRITQLREKPSLTLFINAGIYLLEPTACDLIPDGEYFDMTDLIKRLLEEGRTVVSFPIIEYWLDIGARRLPAGSGRPGESLLGLTTSGLDEASEVALLVQAVAPHHRAHHALLEVRRDLRQQP